jgi:paraquat-inducible protein A
MSNHFTFIVCHDCDLLQQIRHLPEDGAIKCCRCHAMLRKRQRIKPEQSLQHTLALVISAFVLLIIANVYPILNLQIQGHELTATLFSGVRHFYTHDMKLLSGLVFMTAIGAPLLQLSGLLYILLPLNFKYVPWHAPQVYRFVKIITSWSMLEVFLLGILVSIVKLAAMATVLPGIALWSFGALIFLIAAILNDLDTEMLWEQISSSKPNNELPIRTSEFRLLNCHNCHFLCTITLSPNDDEPSCPRCSAELHLRKPDSISRSTALLIAAFIMYIPANLYPVMVVTSLGSTEGDTIMGGAIYLANSGDWPLALIIFIASIFVPTIKLLILSFLLISIHLNLQWQPVGRTRLYRLTEVIGRWSMVDIYVVTLMAALVQIQGLAEIEAGPGAVAFGVVVVLTLLAAMEFDPRLIWDNLEKKIE